MSFTKNARIIAFILCIFGVFLGFWVAFQPDLSGWYFSSQRSSGQQIDKGILIFAAGIFFGILSDISRSLTQASITIDKES